MPAIGFAAAIQILPLDVISRIAAGEVIERPAAVVKELVENSLDAGSRHIAIDIKDGGLSLIRVVDNGEGIKRIDLPLAFERHATSKLRSDRDLASVTTLGFRGEALPSIASVSKVAITTSTRQESAGAHLTLVGGVQQALVDAPPIHGTKIEVTDLFYNQPARKKFLKSNATELSHISHAVQQAALAWPSVHFRLTHNGHELLNCPAVASDRDRILQIYRASFLDRSVEVRGRVPGCALSGVAIDPVQARASRMPQDLFVNRRPVRNAAVVHAVMEAYGSCLPKGHQPTFVLFLDIDPNLIDVNVHPAKREVRFVETDAIHRLISHSVRHAFDSSERIILMEPSTQVMETERSDAAARTPMQSEESSMRAAKNQAGSLASGQVAQSRLSFAQESPASYGRESIPDILPLGQILRRYLVAHVGQELQIIDQHTAHERVIFERLWRNWQTRTLTAQPLLMPELVELSVAQWTVLQSHLGELEQLGLCLESFGAATVAIRAVPAGLGNPAGAALVQDLLDDLAQWDRASSLDDRARPVLASLACHSAVRAGRAMALPEISQLIADWIQEGLITTCPHGRRTVFRLSTDELDKLFGRAGWS